MSSDSKPSQPSAQGPTQVPDGVRDSGPGATRTTLGKYKLGQRLGAGGMGWVYLAFDTERKHSVALKVLPRSKAANPVLVQRFKSEAKAASQLSHRNIIRIFEAGEADGYLYIALEYFKGTDVHNLVGRLGVLPVARSIDMIRQMAEALDHAFDKAIVHRDVKPSNLLVNRDGAVKLADLGLARSIDETDDASLTRAGTTVGTVDYMAPEQARSSRAADIRSDIYSLGCTWYHMLTGEPPFPGGTLTNKLFAHVSSARPDPREKNAAIPSGVVDVIHKMMARKPKDRFQTPTELLEALDNLAEEGDDEVVIDDIENANFERTLNDALGRETSSEIRTISTPSAVRIPARPRRATHSGSIWDHVNGGQVALGVFAVAVFGLLYWALVHFGGDQGHDVVVMAPVNDPSNVAATTPTPAPQTAEPSKQINADPKTQPAPEPVAAAPPSAAPPRNDPPPKSDTPPAAATETPALPDWVETIWPEKVASQLPVATVGRDEDDPATFSDLSKALSKAPGAGQTVELVGPGPFALPPLKIAAGTSVILRGNADSRPIVVCVGRRNSQTDSVLSMEGGSLVLEHLHIVLAGDAFDAAKPISIVDIASGDVVVRDCSFTVRGVRSAPVTALRISGSNDAEAASKVLLERTFFRGDALCPLSASNAPVDLVARECLFVTGRAPVVQATGGDSTAGKPARVLRFHDCTAAVQQNAFQFERGQDAAWSNTAIECLNSLFAIKAQTADSALLSLVGFSATNQSGSANGLRFAADECVFAGWGDLVRTQPDASIRVQGPAQWSRFWEVSVDTLRFPSDQWPPVPIRDFANVQAADFNGSSLGANGNEASAGCDVSQLQVFDGDWLPRALNLAYRPVSPSPIMGKEISNTVGILLPDDDLGTVISKKDWPDGTEFVVTGTGTAKSTPIRVRNKSLRIRFHGAARQYAEIVPKQIDQTAADDADGALIFVENGNLEIEGAHFRIPSSSSRAAATRILKVVKGNFAIRNSSMIGPSPTTPKFEGLIEWTRPGQTQRSALLAGKYLQYAEIDNSYLNTSRSLFSVDGRGFGLQVRNSLLVSLENIFQVDLSGEGAGAASAIDVERCTLSAGNRHFDFNFGPVVHPESPSIRAYVRETLFAPAVPAIPPRKSGAIAVSAPQAVWPQQKLLWCGDRNGYAEEIAAFTLDRSESAAADRQDFDSAWAQAVAPHSDLHSIWKPGDAALNASPADPANVTPGDLTVATSSKAARWSIEGRAIGANVASLVMPDPTAKSVPTEAADKKRFEKSRPVEIPKKPVEAPKKVEPAPANIKAPSDSFSKRRREKKD